MSTIAELTLPAAEFALHETLETVPEAKFEIERVVAHDSQRVMPFVWAADEAVDRETLDEALDADPSVANVTALADFEDDWLYRMEWVTDIRVVLHVLLERDGTILTANGRDDRWYLRILFPDRESLSATHDFCREEGLAFDVRRVYELDSERRDQHGLTDAQHETLVTALERGYFDIPQATTLDELATEFDVSRQALSERLHRGHKALIESALVVGRFGE